MVTSEPNTSLIGWISRVNGTRVGRHVYSQRMGANLLKLLQRHAEDFGKYPDHRLAPALATGLRLMSPTMEEFDHTFTRVEGGSSPPFPFDSSDDCYTWASSHKVLPDIRVPFLTVNAADDPIVQEVPDPIHQICGRCSALAPQHGQQGQPQPTSGDDSDKEEKEKHW